MFSFVSIVADEEEAKNDEVHEDGFRKGKALASEAPDALAKREVEALDMVCLSFLFGAGLMLVGRHHLLIRLPQITKAKSLR